MEVSKFPEFINEENFGVDGFSLPFEEQHKEEEEEENYLSTVSWDSTKAWLLWLIWLEIYLSLIFVVLLILYALYLRYANKTSIVYCTSEDTMEGKTVLITVSQTGVGLETARDLAVRGARVILATSNIKPAQDMAASLETSISNGGKILVKRLDTASLKDVRNFANDILKTEKRLDVLILTASTPGNEEKCVTEEGLEQTMATNHLGHFLLVNLLLGLLKESAPCRVVVMATSAHYLLSSFSTKDLDFTLTSYGALRAYALSMACNLLMACNLAHLTKELGVTVNSVCPGMVKSHPYLQGTGLITRLYLTALYIASRTDNEGAQTLVHLAVSKDVAEVTGGFYTDCQERGPTSLGNDFGLAKKIWERCEEIVGLIPSTRDG